MMVGDVLSSIFIRRKRSIADVIPDVAVEEIHSDDLIVTDHPVEQGASISDHAFKKPAEVALRYGWSNSSAVNNVMRGGLTVSVEDVYQKLLALQESREPFDLITGKRAYNNMLIVSLKVETNIITNDVLYISAICRQIITVPTYLTAAAPHEDQSNPEVTGNVEVFPIEQPQPLLAIPDGINAVEGLPGSKS
ncbi:phage baseplate protein [Bordetella avium]|uniref:phage baseplate protein n=1 Tax=Bordetella avium TaxID=521 RepID=UPI000E0A04FE|nr:hypothetical protein [Bordetella avium]UOK17559.1 hypothetical protein vBBaMIFTN9_18 [Bordetella phage vB_BaM-IFTN9]RIQ11483.1 hypothetical protein D0432_16650 [Bordetella avium]RIQ17448.1 hypothetical protein D0850_11330 [Bordetella avium]RIQ42359.1 hypothetical protein D0847_10625 [Bordetella avium]RIQ42809.1 hypothetical protein D0846_12125 [Bordetella avium]